MSIKLSKFDAADYLDDAETQAHFISAALETGEIDHIRKALAAVTRARGISAVAKEIGITRQGLNKALSENGDPKMTTLLRLVKVLGFKLSLSPAA